HRAGVAHPPSVRQGASVGLSPGGSAKPDLPWAPIGRLPASPPPPPPRPPAAHPDRINRSPYPVRPRATGERSAHKRVPTRWQRIPWLHFPALTACSAVSLAAIG